MAIQHRNFVVIQGWMLTECHLEGKELLLYAVLWGFSQQNDSWYTGRQAYLREWLGCSKNTFLATVRGLMQKGLVDRREREERGVVFVEYRAIVPKISYSDFTAADDGSLDGAKTERGKFNF